MSTSIFDSLLLLSRAENTPDNQLISCLKIIAKYTNVTIQWETIENIRQISLNTLEEQEKSIGFSLHPLTINTLNNLPDSAYPILIEEKTHGKLAVFLKKTGRSAIFFNPFNNKNEVRRLDSKISINRAWHCIPQNLPITSGYFSFIKFTLQFFKSRIMKAASLGILVSAATLVISMLSGIVLTHLLEINHSHFFIIFGAIFLFSVGTSGFFYANGLFVKAINADILFLILPNVVNHIFNLPMQVTQKFVSSDISQRITDYEASVSNLIKTSLSFFFNCIGLLILLTYMGYCSVKLALLYLVICLIFLIFKTGLFPKSIKNLNSQLGEQSKLNAFLVETLLQIHKIRSANAEDEVFNRWFHKLILSKIFSETSIKIEIFILALDSALPVMLLLCFYSILYFSSNRLQSYDLIQFMVCAGQFSIVFQKLSLELVMLVQLIPGLKRLDPLLSEKTETNNASAAVVDFKQQLSLSHVYFRNSDNGNCILEDVSLTIPAGKFVAIVGRSGAGKSTVFRLLLGLESTTSGSILVDNESMDNFNIKDIRKQFGVVLQTTSLFPGSIFSNISANSNITIEEAWRLASTVGLDEEINSMPMKMFTYVSDNASESLSGGQKQKILIARALATHPTILLLDEATSALDSKSQALVHKNLSLLNITRIVIAHRYSTIMDADIIYVMEKGKVIDYGTYHELKPRKSLPSPGSAF
jgi:ABC-type bacteriocin/lantibiotic exporter with double-glycine peptidase domain